ncbi:unnamed protein product [Symbiodinium sp. CCMP2456]|nr:unnamed protein product [Symbiodinium sp. CCMP2456]
MASLGLALRTDVGRALLMFAAMLGDTKIGATRPTIQGWFGQGLEGPDLLRAAATGQADGAKLLSKVGAVQDSLSAPAFRSSSRHPKWPFAASRSSVWRRGTECLLLMGSGFLV